MNTFSKRLLNNLYFINLNKDEENIIKDVLNNINITKEKVIFFNKIIKKILRELKKSHDIILKKYNLKLSGKEQNIEEGDIFHLIDCHNIMSDYPYVFNTSFSTTTDFLSIIKDIKKLYFGYKQLLRN